MAKCPYCGAPAQLVDSRVIYGRSYGAIWLCRCVDGFAYVGCHPNTTTPLGTLADRATRAWRSRAHRAFDPLWRNGAMSRTAAYRWLADMLGITGEACHIARADIEMCRRIVGVCRAAKPRPD